LNDDVSYDPIEKDSPNTTRINRSVFRRKKGKVKTAETVTSFRKTNIERNITEEESYDSIFGAESSGEPSAFSGKSGSHFDSIFGDGKTSSSLTVPSNNVTPAGDDTSGFNTSDFANFPPSSDPYQEPLPGVNNLNMRERMLYKNQMYLHSNPKNASAPPSKSRIASRYESEERSDWLVNGEEGEENAATEENEDESKRKKRWGFRNKVSSPTGVEELDAKDPSPSPKKTKSKSSKKLSVKPSRYSFDDASTHRDEDDDTRTYDDDTRTYDDDTRTYDDETNYDDTTVGDTIEDTTLGESTYASYDEDDTYASEKKYSPGHKKGNRPEPILKTSTRSKDEKGDRRVIIHSHRGRKSRRDDNEFADAMCPFPSLTDIKEEVRGTCKDAKSAFHQVLHAFVIGPDDIDRMSDKIRDAKLELAENYHRQVKERKRGDTAGGKREMRL
jgi:hypothetical protein